MTDTTTDSATVPPDPDEFPPNVLGASALIVSIVGVFLVYSLGLPSLIGIGLGIGSLVRSRRHRGQRGGVGIAAILFGVLGLIVKTVVMVRILSTLI